MNFINIFKLFIRTERTGDLNLHLVAVGKILNVFATGHFNYAKSARLYLQMMLELPSSPPWLYNNLFSNGYHTVRKSDRYWAELWTDLTIEQVMMRIIKSRGGLTREEEWANPYECYGSTACINAHKYMNLWPDLLSSSTQQVTSTQRWENRVSRGTLKIWQRLVNGLTSMIHFWAKTAYIAFLHAGLTVPNESGINCDQMEKVGAVIQEQINNIVYSGISLKRKDVVKPLANLVDGVKFGKSIVHINPAALFTRLLVLVERADDMAP